MLSDIYKREYQTDELVRASIVLLDEALTIMVNPKKNEKDMKLAKQNLRTAIKKLEKTRIGMYSMNPYLQLNGEKND